MIAVTVKNGPRLLYPDNFTFSGGNSDIHLKIRAQDLKSGMLLEIGFNNNVFVKVEVESISYIVGD